MHPYPNHDPKYQAAVARGDSQAAEQIRGDITGECRAAWSDRYRGLTERVWRAAGELLDAQDAAQAIATAMSAGGCAPHAMFPIETPLTRAWYQTWTQQLRTDACSPFRPPAD